MKISAYAVVLSALLVAPAFADVKLDEAFAKASEQNQKGKPEDALKTMQKAVSQCGNCPEGNLLLGRLQERIGNFEDAGAAYSAAAAGSGPGKADGLAALADYELRTTAARSALAHAEQAVATEANPVTLSTLARVLARLDPPKALITGDKAVAAGAASAAAHHGRGAALLALGRTEEALAAFRKAAELDPSHARAVASIAVALTSQSKGAEAVTAARKAVELAPNSAEAHAILGAAILTQDKNLWGEAIAEAQDGAFKNAKDPEIQMIVARIFEADGRYDQATVALKRALDTDPEFAPARTALIDNQFRRGDLDGALAEATKLVAQFPNNGEAQLKVGEFLLRKENYSAAVAPLEKAVTLLPGSAEAHYYLGRAYQFTGKTKEALEPYRKAVAAAPSNLDFRTTYGLLLGVNGQYEAGVAELKKVVASPGYKNTAGYTNLGWLYRNIDPPKTEESIAAYRKALELDPKNGQAALGLGWAASYSKKHDEAISAFQKSIGIDASLAPQALKGMAWSYFFKKDFAKSRETLLKADGAGAGDSRLEAQLDRIDKIIKEGRSLDEKEMAEAEKERAKAIQLQNKLDALQDDLKSQNAATRARAASEIARVAGGDAVPILHWMLANDKSYDVRTSVANALGSLGSASRRAYATLKAIGDEPVTPDVFGTKEAIEREQKELAFKKACREAAAKIGR
jgi:tetratricopeptide (TPR) repeat protein